MINKKFNNVSLIVLAGLLLLSMSLASNLPVYIDNEIYGFLERMEGREIINGYSGLDLPLRRDEIAQFLEQIGKSTDQLNRI